MGGAPERARDLVDVEDVDEIIGIAARHANADADKLTITELVDIGAELGLQRAAVERAARELEARRAAERAAAEKRLASRRKALRVALVASAAALVASITFAWVGHASLAGSLAQVDEARSQVDNVVARRADVKARLAANPGVDANDRNAELAGSENRVAVEKRRYDQAATGYNEKASSFPGDLWARVFGMPSRVPLSRESSTW